MHSLVVTLVGDRSDEVVAHRCIPVALSFAARSIGVDATVRWCETPQVEAAELKQSAALWLTPGSPYRNTAGAFTTARIARLHGIPFLGTCGGFQHALLEIALDVSGLDSAAHAETSPDAPDAVIHRLSCSLVEQTRPVRFLPGSRLAQYFQGRDTAETYHCNYGFNERFRQRLEAAGVVFTCFDQAGDVRGFELTHHPFFVGTLFQPERSALRGESHPLIESFLRAAAARTVA